MDGRVGKRVKNARAAQDSAKPLAHLFDVFYNAKVAEGRSRRTLEMYRENFAAFCAYLDDCGLERSLTAVTPDVLRSYMAWMAQGRRKWEGHAHKHERNMTVGLSPVTVNTRMKSLRTMFKFLEDDGQIPTDPCAKVRKMKEPEKETEILTVDELQRLLKAPDQRTYAGFRDYVAMNVLIDGFFRINEVLTLRTGDIDLHTGMVTVKETVAKSRKARYVPLQKRTLRLLRDLIDENADFDTDAIFLTNYGGALTDDQFRNRLKEHAERAGLTVNIYPHLFRHTSATLFLENGGSERYLAEILGHADMRMIMRYTHLSRRKSVKDQHDQYSPINDVVGKLARERKTKR